MNAQAKRIVKRFISPNLIRRSRFYMQQREINKIGVIKTAPFCHDYDKGINLIGSFRHDSGLGQSCRLLADEIKETGLNYSFIDFTSSAEISSSDYGYDNLLSKEFRYGVNIWHVNMHEFVLALKTLGIRKLNGHKNIAFWLWEMEEFPSEWIPLIHVLDEIWTPSEFVSNALRKVTQKPVITVPYAMEVLYDSGANREYFGLPSDKFLYLMAFDSHSISERKNPKAVLEAFKSAFSLNPQQVGLVIKINHMEDNMKRWIDEEMKGYNIYYVSGMLSKEKMNALIKVVDVYVSLHRAEGFGLVLAEAMFLGTPTIATNYSSNTEFQTVDTACLVDYKRVSLERDMWPYKGTDVWAEPSINQAAEYMRRLYEDRALCELIRQNAISHVKEVLDMNRIKKIIVSRIEGIYEID